jgi:hypothetical protein
MRSLKNATGGKTGATPFFPPFSRETGGAGKFDFVQIFVYDT